MIEQLRKVNKDRRIESVFDVSFKPFGRVIHNVDVSRLIDVISSYDTPETGNRYVALDEQAMQAMDAEVLKELFGDIEVQVGYVNGKNSKLNALEYHKSSEVNVAVTDLVLMLGKTEDIIDNTYDSRKLKIFYVPKGTVIEVYGTSLHFAPCKVQDEGFKCAVILPKGTNVDFVKTQRMTEESKLLFKTNKWLLAHPDHTTFIEQGAHVGIKGENIEILYK